MRSYLAGFLKHFFQRRISMFALVDADSKISGRARIYYLSKIHQSVVGAYTYIAPRTSIVYANIGKFCSIASDCSIGLASHSMGNISTSPLFTSRKNATGFQWVDSDTFDEYAPVIVGNDVWIGTKVLVMGGVRIGHGVVVGAGSIVTHDLPDYSVAVGVPARVIKYRYEEQVIKRLLELRWWEMPEEDLIRNIKIFKKQGVTLDDLENFK
ncbi:MAG: CatB-related O-acetyltransferase [Bacteroidota bacterium]